jgi:hypothetical protein
MDNMGVYVPKLKRMKKEQLSQKPTSITMEFLAVRDMFCFFVRERYRFDWSEGKQWWNANEATIAAHERVMRHMETVVMDATNR